METGLVFRSSAHPSLSLALPTGYSTPTHTLSRSLILAIPSRFVFISCVHVPVARKGKGWVVFICLALICVSSCTHTLPTNAFTFHLCALFILLSLPWLSFLLQLYFYIFLFLYLTVPASYLWLCLFPILSYPIISCPVLARSSAVAFTCAHRWCLGYIANTPDLLTSLCAICMYG